MDLIAQPQDAPLSHIAVSPSNPDRERTSQVLADNRGTGSVEGLHRIIAVLLAGWTLDAFTNFETGRSETKSSYAAEFERDGRWAVTGRGVYQRGLPSICDDAEVNAAGLEGNPNGERMQGIVRCAALVMQSSWLFAAAKLSRNRRWRGDSVHVFGLDIRGNELFSGGECSRGGTLDWSEYPAATHRPAG